MSDDTKEEPAPAVESRVASLLDQALDMTIRAPRFGALEGPERPVAPTASERTIAGPEVGADEPKPSPSLRILSPAGLLAREPTRFHPDEAAAITARVAKKPARDLDFRSPVRLGAPAGAVVSAKPADGQITLGTFGLIGPGGVLPRHHTATVAGEVRKRSRALNAFMDLLARRMAGAFTEAGTKYRPTRNPAPARLALAATIGMATPGLDGRLALPLDALLYHSGNLASRSRSAERLRGMLDLRYQGGLNAGQIGERLGLSAEGVRMALMRGRQALARCLSGRLAGADGGGAS